MENKQSFYKTFEEKMVAKISDRYYNDEIGGRENHFYDEGEMLPMTEEELVAYIVRSITACKTVLWTEGGYGLEAKHIRFMGKKRIEEIVAHRVRYRHTKEGAWVWEE